MHHLHCNTVGEQPFAVARKMSTETLPTNRILVELGYRELPPVGSVCDLGASGVDVQQKNSSKDSKETGLGESHLLPAAAAGRAVQAAQQIEDQGPKGPRALGQGPLGSGPQCPAMAAPGSPVLPWDSSDAPLESTSLPHARAAPGC